MKKRTFICDTTLQNWLVKLSCIVAGSNYRLNVVPEDIQLAYIDLVEFYDCVLDFVTDRINGMFDYGGSWKGAKDKDRSCLMWLYDNGGSNESSTEVAVNEFKEAIARICKSKESSAHIRYCRFKKEKWIESKQIGQYDSKVWLTFDPNINYELQGVQGIKGVTSYLEILSNYDNLISTLKGITPLTPLTPSEPMLRNGKNGKNGRSPTVSEVSEVSEHRFPKDINPFIKQDPTNKVLSLIPENDLISTFNVVSACNPMEEAEIMAILDKLRKEGLNRARRQGKQLGRPKGSKDQKRRKRGGYYLRYRK